MKTFKAKTNIYKEGNIVIYRGQLFQVNDKSELPFVTKFSKTGSSSTDWNMLMENYEEVNENDKR